MKKKDNQEKKKKKKPGKIKKPPIFLEKAPPKKIKGTVLKPTYFLWGILGNSVFWGPKAP